MATAFVTLAPIVCLTDTLGSVSHVGPRFGNFAPDDMHSGRREDILAKCAELKLKTILEGKRCNSTMKCGTEIVS